MAIEFDMKVVDRSGRLAQDRPVVHQGAGGDQHVVYEHSMGRRYDEVAAGQPHPAGAAQGAGPDADRAELRIGADQGGRIGAAADPTDRPGRPVTDTDEPANLQMLDGNRSGRRGDQGAGGKAGGKDDGGAVWLAACRELARVEPARHLQGQQAAVAVQGEPGER